MGFNLGGVWKMKDDLICAVIISTMLILFIGMIVSVVYYVVTDFEIKHMIVAFVLWIFFILATNEWAKYKGMGENKPCGEQDLNRFKRKTKCA